MEACLCYPYVKKSMHTLFDEITVVKFHPLSQSLPPAFTYCMKWHEKMNINCKFMVSSLYSWLSDRLLSNKSPFLFLHSHPPWIWIQDGHGLASLSVLRQQVFPFSMAPNGKTNSENKGEFSVGFTPTTLGRMEHLEHRMGHAGFLRLSLREGWCVWRPSWTALKQLAVSDGPKGCLPLPSGMNTFFFKCSSVLLWEIMWGVSRSQSLKWYILNWHSALDRQSYVLLRVYVDGN